MKYLNICLNTLYGIQSHSYNILAQMVHACIRLSSHCNFIRLKVTPRTLSEAGNKLK